MKTSPVTPDDLARSVIAVPPVAWSDDGGLADAPNRRLAAYLHAGGVTSILYGGNANFYHLGVDPFARVLETLEAIAPSGVWMIPSIGPDYGKMQDQAKRLARSSFPTAMALPMSGPSTPNGVATGLRRVAETFGRPVVLYIRAENYVHPDQAAKLVEDGAVCTIKYAVGRDDPSKDAYLDALVAAVGRERLASGMGERPAVAHMRDFKLAGFTSGLVCIAPKASMAILAACKAGRFEEALALREHFLPLEDLRDRHSQIRVLHDALTVSGIADMGAALPLLDNVEPVLLAKLEAPVRALMALEQQVPAAA